MNIKTISIEAETIEMKFQGYLFENAGIEKQYKNKMPQIVKYRMFCHFPLNGYFGENNFFNEITPFSNEK